MAHYEAIQGENSPTKNKRCWQQSYLYGCINLTLVTQGQKIVFNIEVFIHDDDAVNDTLEQS